MTRLVRCACDACLDNERFNRKLFWITVIWVGGAALATIGVSLWR